MEIITYNNTNLITRKQFIDQVFELEGVKIALREDREEELVKQLEITFGVNAVVLLSPYPYEERMDGNKTIDDLLNERIVPHMNMTSVIMITSFKGFMQ